MFHDDFDLDLTDFGAPGFSLTNRVDMTGHQSGRVDPHLNADIVRPNGSILGRFGRGADFRDLIHNQLPDFNGMQDK